MRIMLRKSFSNWKIKVFSLNCNKNKTYHNEKKEEKFWIYNQNDIKYEKKESNDNITNNYKDKKDKNHNLTDSYFTEYSSITALNNRHLNYEKLKKPLKKQKEKTEVLLKLLNDYLI